MVEEAVGPMEESATVFYCIILGHQFLPHHQDEYKLMVITPKDKEKENKSGSVKMMITL